jgi:hypothetical protein
MNDTAAVVRHLPAQEDRRDTVQLEGVQTVLAPHVQEQVQTQTPADRHIPQVILARGELELLCLKGFVPIPRDLSREIEGYTELRSPRLEIRVIKSEGVIPTHHIRVHLGHLCDELLQELLLARAGDILDILLLGRIHRAPNKHDATRGFQHVRRPAIGDPNLDDGVSRLRLREFPGPGIHLEVIASHEERDGRLVGDDVAIVGLPDLVDGIDRLAVLCLGNLVQKGRLYARERRRRTEMAVVEEAEERRKIRLIERTVRPG